MGAEAPLLGEGARRGGGGGAHADKPSMVYICVGPLGSRTPLTRRTGKQ